jgi:hypothetical protein
LHSRKVKVRSWFSSLAMHERLDCGETILALIRQLESTVLGLRQLRDYVDDVALQMVDLMIEEDEAKIGDIKRNLQH